MSNEDKQLYKHEAERLDQQIAKELSKNYSEFKKWVMNELSKDCDE